MNRMLVVLIAYLNIGLTPSLLMSRECAKKDMAVAMWARSELRTNHIKLLDVGCGECTFLPRAVKYLESIGFIVDKAIGIDNGFGLDVGRDLVEHWNEKLESDRVEVKFMDVKDVKKLGYKFDISFFIAPHKPQDTGERVNMVLKVMREDGIIVIAPHTGEFEIVEASLLKENIPYEVTKTLYEFTTNYHLDGRNLVVRRSEARHCETDRIFAKIMVDRILEKSA